MTHAESYLAQVVEIGRLIDPRMVEDIAEGLAGVRVRGGRLFLLGVGGSVANCAHAVAASKRPLRAYSFHETKNVIAGEGGALLVNDSKLNGLAEVVWEKGTDRTRFFRGEVDKYTWQYLGSSFWPSELAAAFLWSQLQEAEEVTRRRLAIWELYHTAFAAVEKAGLLRRPRVPIECRHNAHMYYILLPEVTTRTYVLRKLNERGIHAIFHYVPLHDSPAGLKYGRAHGGLRVTEELSQRIVRLPLWVGLEASDVDRVVSSVESLAKEAATRSN